MKPRRYKPNPGRYARDRENKLKWFLIACRRAGVSEAETADLVACFVVFQKLATKKQIGFASLPFTARQFQKFGPPEPALKSAAYKILRDLGID